MATTDQVLLTSTCTAGTVNSAPAVITVAYSTKPDEAGVGFRSSIERVTVNGANASVDAIREFNTTYDHHRIREVLVSCDPSGKRVALEVSLRAYGSDRGGRDAVYDMLFVPVAFD